MTERTRKPAPAEGRALPQPPPELGADARAEWERAAGELDARGFLTTGNRAAFAAYCQAYERWMMAERALAKMAAADSVTSGLLIKTSNGNAIQNPLVGIANTAMSAMVRFAAELGMTPASRGRVLPESERPGDGAASGGSMRWRYRLVANE